MKRIILLLLTLFMANFITAQQNFQGVITYNLHESIKNKPDAILKIYFGTNKIKMRFKEKEDYDKEEIIVLLDSAAKYIVNTETKTYRKKILSVSIPKQYQKKIIEGYNTTLFKNENNGLESLFGGSMEKTNVVFYLADSLYYTIPAAFADNAELVAIQKNKIVLGADIEFKAGAYDVSDSSIKDDVIKVEAIEIKPMKISDDEFNIPADYVSKMNNDYEPLTDSIAVDKMPVEDTAVIKYPEKRNAAKKPVKPNKSGNTVKPITTGKKE